MWCCGAFQSENKDPENVESGPESFKEVELIYLKGVEKIAGNKNCIVPEKGGTVPWKAFLESLR